LSLSLKVKPAEPDDLPEALTLLNLAFPEQDNLYYLTGDPGYKLERTRLLLKGNQPVGVLQIFERQVRWRSGLERVGCVGNLTVHPNHRGKGYASKLLEEAVSYMRGEGFHYSLLFTRIPGFYERFGWRRVPLTLFSGFLKNGSEAGKLKGSVRRFHVDTDLKSLLKVYDRFNEDRWGTVVRDEPLWRSELKWLFDEDFNQFLLYEEETVKSYVRCHKHRPYIMEFGFEKGCEDSVKALVHRCASMFKGKRGEDRIYLPVLKDPEIDGFLKSQLSNVRECSTSEIGLDQLLIKALDNDVDEKALNRMFFWYPDHF
jgi:GNAT superfamily N-acetyltransferase